MFQQKIDLDTRYGFCLVKGLVYCKEGRENSWCHQVKVSVMIYINVNVNLHSVFLISNFFL
jgi:hypothetical protein